MSEYRPNEETPDTAEIRRDIETTRSEMGSTIDALQEKLSPDNIKAEVQATVTEQAEHVKEQVQEAITHQVETVKAQVRDATVGRVETMVSNVSDTARSLVGGSNGSNGGHGGYGGTTSGSNGLLDTIKANPVPAAMVGLGLGWLFANRGGSSHSSSRDQGRYDRYGDSNGGTRYGGTQYRDAYDGPPSVGDRLGGTAQAAGDRLGDAAQGAKERVGDLADSAGERVGDLTDRAQYGAQRAKGTFQQTLEENPLMVGAVAMALGLAAGLSLPGTEAENRLLGESRDNLVEQAQAKAQETIQKVQQVAQDVQPAVVDAAKESAQKQGLVGQQS